MMLSAKTQMLKVLSQQPENSSHEDILRELACATMVERGFVNPQNFVQCVMVNMMLNTKRNPIFWKNRISHNVQYLVDHYSISKKPSRFPNALRFRD